jgi:hypothetical protein
VSYGADLALQDEPLGSHELFEAWGRLRTNQVKEWETEEGGGAWASGVGGPGTGKGTNYGSIDDPIKNAQDASSAKKRESLRDWYQSVWSTRWEENPVQLLVNTRWDEGDLSGWILQNEQLEIEEGGEPDGWWIVWLPAIAVTPDQTPKFPSSCWVEPDWREPGQALWPERFDLKRLERIRARIGEYFFAALYQQTPTPSRGRFF